ncbi:MULTISPECIES: hypothetical protein [Flavobacterium]|jgi:hypothetical protein|uniref:Uncharacterized protein n=1 Tax=Flavobacterium johnsoniae (strain ATCC 17061 / DSM 2064 / JCM 8514 / BCRC 14874 / CCUG 350202 / NBRC 14942 / NCIMB 11054 / UW101) TaxID=376686 RepID=A5FNL3_FLAJ1|nr:MULTISPECIES: hypothetical protein [Flavobacterium]ABQ03214.1 hypothetical protein Fjoh_0177 [Flavobacterium johnsoniae UW101]OXG01362.1 hypothetical protein B0A63_07630 [Flavobacterium johnsoniae UW101]WDF58968.1 hypothetical protein PQ462_19895 [Flavobacterium sp. KACC 22758]WQG79923.1 hypothetical protein SR927_18070 [Flavobacterium johnsoniae UW101]SHL81915.1 hypothetical protein SAMN05444146_4694 [Flavobacterium johnsoniae]
MNFVKGQDVFYTTLSGRSYRATVIERKIDFKKGLIKKSAIKEMTYHYLIEVHKVGIKEQILCTENQIKLLEKKQRAKKAA